MIALDLPLTRDNARMLLDRADRLGIDQRLVQTTDSGFVVPDALTVEPERKAPSRRRRTTVEKE